MGNHWISEEEEGGNEPLERPRCLEWTALDRSIEVVLGALVRFHVDNFEY